MLAQQIRSQHVDMDSLKTVLPDFGLRVSAGRDNILSSFLRTKRIAFSNLDIAGTNCDSCPYRSGCAWKNWLTAASFSTP